MIGIIGAMDMEVNGLKERMLNTQVRNHWNQLFL